MGEINVDIVLSQTVWGKKTNKNANYFECYGFLFASLNISRFGFRESILYAMTLCKYH